MNATPTVCPFCPLCCDDVVARRVGDTVEVRFGIADGEAVQHRGCTLALPRYKATLVPGPARIADRRSEATDWTKLADQLQFPATPVVAVRQPSVEEAKQLREMQSGGQIRLHVFATESESALDQTFRRIGAVSATLGDAIARADLIWTIGDLDTRLPRLRERLAGSSADLVSSKQVSLATLSALQRSSHPSSRESEPSIDAAEQSLVRSLRQSQYLAIVLGDAPFEAGREVIAAEGLLRWTTDRNQQTLSGDDDGEVDRVHRAVLVRWSGDQNLSAVLCWHHNRIAPSTLSVPAAADIWLGESGPTAPAEPTRLQIGGIDPGPKHAEAYLPASHPGIHFPATTVRGDGSVTLPLGHIADPVLPGRVEILQQILNRP